MAGMTMQGHLLARAVAVVPAPGAIWGRVRTVGPDLGLTGH